jgi:3-hydroxyisobutyrate dehydrogenase-like beta-hydroxyacid dehydrogenase
MDVAFIGLGQMGSGMAGRFIDAGHRVTVWNRGRSKSEPFERRGARITEPTGLPRDELPRLAGVKRTIANP